MLKDSLFNKWCWKNWSTTKNETRTLSNTIHKINSKWIKYLNIRPETLKILEENRQNTLWHKSQQDPLWTTSQSNGNKSKDKWDLIKFKSFWTMKETINKLKRQPSAWEEIITNEATDKELISKVYKQLMQLNTRK